MTIFGALRIKNEGRWIAQVVNAMLPLCERVFILDDNSDDGTPELCERMHEKVTVFRSTEATLDERRDKQFLLQRIMGCVSDIRLSGDTYSPYWVLALDGDELLDRNDYAAITSKLASTRAHAFKLPIRYLWDSDMSLLETHGHRRVRMDGVYKTFARPSIFRLFNRSFQYQKTPWGGNFHCSSIPQELLGHAHETIPATVWHLGYSDKADRIRKFIWYSKIDPNNQVEDRYRHMIQGDGPVKLESGEVIEIPPTATLKHAGPLHVEMM